MIKAAKALSLTNPSVEVILKTLLTLPITNSSAERSFSIVEKMITKQFHV